MNTTVKIFALLMILAFFFLMLSGFSLFGKSKGPKLISEQYNGQPRFTKNACGVIKDQKTGLEYFVPPQKHLNYTDAELMVTKLTECGGNWRMPKIYELVSIYNKTLRASKDIRVSASSSSQESYYYRGAVKVVDVKTSKYGSRREHRIYAHMDGLFNGVENLAVIDSKSEIPNKNVFVFWAKSFINQKEKSNIFSFVNGKNNRRSVGWKFATLAVRGKSDKLELYQKTDCGSVKDTTTGFEWYYHRFYKYSKAYSMARKEAVGFLSEFDECGEGWRLPTVKELSTLYRSDRAPKGFDRYTFPYSGSIFLTMDKNPKPGKYKLELLSYSARDDLPIDQGGSGNHNIMYVRHK